MALDEASHQAVPADPDMIEVPSLHEGQDLPRRPIPVEGGERLRHVGGPEAVLEDAPKSAARLIPPARRGL